MSVQPSFESLLRIPPTFLPRRLKALAAAAGIDDKTRVLLGRAAGSNSLRLWQMGEGPFRAGAMADELVLRPNGDDHGLVEPARRMLLARFQDALAETGDLWSSAEPAADEAPHA